MKIATRIGLLLCMTFATGCAVDSGEPDIEPEINEIEQASEATPGKWNADFNQLPGWLPWPKKICEALNGASWTITVAGCTSTTTLSNCQYNSSTKNCDCSSSTTRSGTGC